MISIWSDHRKPIHGLIFLFQYVEEEENNDREDCPGHVWLASQTTANACATVAMVNVAMNAEALVLGKTLEDFKVATKDLSAPLRGHMLATNPGIRSAHNSFARWVFESRPIQDARASILTILSGD